MRYLVLALCATAGLVFAQTTTPAVPAQLDYDCSSLWLGTTDVVYDGTATSTQFNHVPDAYETLEIHASAGMTETLYITVDTVSELGALIIDDSDGDGGGWVVVFDGDGEMTFNDDFDRCDDPTFAPTPLPTPLPTPAPTSEPTPVPSSAPSTVSTYKTKVDVIVAPATNPAGLDIYNLRDALDGFLLEANALDPMTVFDMVVTTYPNGAAPGVFSFWIRVDVAALGFTNPQAWADAQDAEFKTNQVAISNVWSTACGGCTFTITFVSVAKEESWPTVMPTYSPTEAPHITASPTLAPTEGDTVTVGVTFELSNLEAPSQANRDSLKGLIVSALGVSASAIKNFEVTSTFTGRRRLLASYTWVCSLDVAVSLSSSGFASPMAFAAFVQSTLTGSAFINAVLSAIGATVDTSSYEENLASRSPSPQPTVEPTKATKIIVVGSGGADAASSGLLIGVVAAALIVVAGVAAVALRRKPANNMDAVLGEGQLQKELELSAAGDGAGGCMNFFRDCGFNLTRAQELSAKFSARGYEDPSDIITMDDDELTDAVLAELSLLAPEIRKFRAAVTKGREALAKQRESAVLPDVGGDVEMGSVGGGGAVPMRAGPHDAACIAFLKTANLVEIFPRIKAEAGGTVTFEEMCNPDFVSDKMLVEFKLNKAQIRRFRRAVDDHAKEADAAAQSFSTSGAASQDQEDADAKAKAGGNMGGASEGGEAAPPSKAKTKMELRKAARAAKAKLDAEESEKGGAKKLGDEFGAEEPADAKDETSLDDEVDLGTRI